ncbi:MAG: SDR family oxidoreductase [Simkania sp.]|nr:SDR family oxidoreductase [Simkania sp.]
MAIEKVVIMGGSSGIGLATAERLAKGSYQVIIASRSKEKIDRALKRIKGNVLGYPVDFTNPEALELFFQIIESLDHLICVGAGEAAWGSFPDIKTLELKQGFENKFWGYFYSAQAALKNMKKKGSITFVIGGACRCAIPGTSGVAAVNGAILSMGLTMAREVAPIRVNLIAPGVTNTPIYDYMPTEEKTSFFKQVGNSLPVGRIGEPDDIAKAMEFVIGNGYLTGAVIDVDGGGRLN